MNMLTNCILALTQAGCDVRPVHDTIIIRFPPVGNDPPDGTEITMSETTFKFVCAKVLLQLAEKGA